MNNILSTSGEESLDALSRRAPRILLVSFLISLVSYGIANTIPVSYDVHFSYVVSQEGRKAVADFQYDGYYALSASDLFTATLASWIAQPQNIVAAYKASNTSLPTEDAVTLATYVRAQKAAPGLVSITVKNSSREKAEAVARGVAARIPLFISQYNTTGTPTVMFQAIASELWTGVSRVSSFPIAVIFFMFAFLAQIIGVLLLR